MGWRTRAPSDRARQQQHACAPLDLTRLSHLSGRSEGECAIGRAGGVTQPRPEMAAPSDDSLFLFVCFYDARRVWNINESPRCVACARWFVADLLQWEPQVQARVGRQIEFCDLESWRGQYGASISDVTIKFITRIKIWMVARLQ